MTNAHSHLTDDQLIELCLSGRPLPDVVCASCDSRRAELTALLRDASCAAVEDADAVFTPDRLARQQTRILQRIELHGRSARVLAFPGQSQDTAAAPRSRPGTRWIAAAAVAGALIGLVAGQLAHGVPEATVPAPTTSVALATDASQPQALRAVATTFSEDEFLGQIESIADSPGGDALRSLHDLTPRAWEVK